MLERTSLPPAVGLYAHNAWTGNTYLIHHQDELSGLFYLTDFSHIILSPADSVPWVIMVAPV